MWVWVWRLNGKCVVDGIQCEWTRWPVTEQTDEQKWIPLNDISLNPLRASNLIDIQHTVQTTLKLCGALYFKRLS